MITVDDVLRLGNWIETGGPPEERARRAEEVKRVLYAGRSEAEAEQIAAVIAEADRVPLLGVPATALSTPEPSAPPAPHYGLVSRDSPAYRRGSLHDGTAAEVARMRARSKGSPFDACAPYAPEAKAPKQRNDLLDDLKQLSTRPARKQKER